MKRYQVGYGKLKKSILFSPHIALKAMEFIEAESITKAMKIALETASALGFEVDIIKEVSLETHEERSQEYAGERKL